MNRGSAVVLGGLVLLTAAGLPGAKGGTAPTVAIDPFEIREIAVENTAAAPTATGRSERLSQEATNRASRTAVRSHLAVRSNITSPNAGDSASRLTGTVWVPLSLGPDVRGRRAFFRPGTFVRAEVKWRGADGMVRESRAQLRWRDVWWTSGGRVRRARSTDDVLRDAVRKAVDAAVKRLAQSAPASSATGSQRL